jgi:hypothetical protein
LIFLLLREVRPNEPSSYKSQGVAEQIAHISGLLRIFLELFWVNRLLRRDADLFLLTLILLITVSLALQFFQKLCFFLELFGSFFLLLPLQALLHGLFFGSLDLVLAALRKLIPHLLLSFGLLGFEF